MCFAGGDGEALLLVRVQMLGDRPARPAAPVEANDILRAVLSSCREDDRLAGGGIGDRAELGDRIVLAGDVVGAFWPMGDVAAGRAGHELTLSATRWGAMVRCWYQATVAAMAVGSGVAAVPNVDWYLLVFSTNRASNSYDISTSSRIVGLNRPRARTASFGSERTPTGGRIDSTSSV